MVIGKEITLVIGCLVSAGEGYFFYGVGAERDGGCEHLSDVTHRTRRVGIKSGYFAGAGGVVIHLVNKPRLPLLQFFIETEIFMQVRRIESGLVENILGKRCLGVE